MLPRRGRDAAFLGDGDVDEHGSQPGVGVRLERGGREAVIGSEVRPVDDRRDPRLRRTQQADQGGGIDVLGPEVIPEVRRRRRGRTVRGSIADVPEEGGPGVPVGVDEARHHDRVGRVDLLGVAGAEPDPDLGDDGVFDQDVSQPEVRRPGAQGEDTSTLEQDPRHPPPRADPVAARASRPPRSGAVVRSLSLREPAVTVQGHYIPRLLLARQYRRPVFDPTGSSQ